MRSILCGVFLAYILMGFSRAESETQDVAQAYVIRDMVFDKIDFNNNTIGEIIIKLNSMIHKASKGTNVPFVLLNLEGMSEEDISKTLNSKILHWKPMREVSLGETATYICQFMNYTDSREGLTVILTPQPPYRERNFDVQAMMDKARAKHPHDQ